MARSGRCLTGSAALLFNDATLLPEPDLAGRTARGGAPAGASFLPHTSAAPGVPEREAAAGGHAKGQSRATAEGSLAADSPDTRNARAGARFLQPWLRSRLAGESNAAKTMVLAVDLSASMGYADGTRTRLAQASSRSGGTARHPARRFAGKCGLDSGAIRRRTAGAGAESRLPATGAPAGNGATGAGRHRRGASIWRSSNSARRKASASWW